MIRRIPRWAKVAGVALAAIWVLGLGLIWLAFTDDDDPPPTDTSVSASQRTSVAAADQTFAARPLATSPPPRPPQYDLALISASCVRPSDTYMECEGFVENVSAITLHDVTAVLVLSDEQGTPIASEDTLIDYEPLLPGQRSPWHVIVRFNPAFSKWRVDFKELFGGEFSVRDDSVH